MALDYYVIGVRIKQSRLLKRMTQEQLAQKLDITTPFLSKIETGAVKVSLKRINQICTILGVSEGYILTGASTDSDMYLETELAELFKKASPEKQKLIYNVVKAIVES